MPITMPVAMLIGTAASGAAAAGSSFARNRAESRARRDENRYTDEALRESRDQREYERRMDAERIQREMEDRAFQRERDAYNRSMDEREFGYRSGRDAVMDDRFNNERTYSRGEFADYKSRLAPYGDIGTRATANLASVVGRQLPAAIPTAGKGAMVRLQSPTGQIGDVPENAVEHYLAKGATRI